MSISATWTDPNTLDLITGQILTQTVWENLLGDLLYVGAVAGVVKGTSVGVQITGNVGIGVGPSSNYALNAQGTINASGAVAVGIQSAPTLVAQANNDVLYGLVVSPVYNDNGKTGVQHLAIYSPGTGTTQLGGNVAIASGATSYYGLGIYPTLTAAGDQRGINLAATFDSTATNGQELTITPGTTAQAFTLANLRGINIANATLGAGSSVTTYTGINIQQLTVGANNYSIQIAHPGASGYAMYVTGASGNPVFRIDDTTITTVGATGGASAPPANPAEYLLINISGNNRKIACYNP